LANPDPPSLELLDLALAADFQASFHFWKKEKIQKFDMDIWFERYFYKNRSWFCLQTATFWTLDPDPQLFESLGSAALPGIVTCNSGT
jgi:hypothetical protein